MPALGYTELKTVPPQAISCGLRNRDNMSDSIGVDLGFRW